MQEARQTPSNRCSAVDDKNPLCFSLGSMSNPTQKPVKLIEYLIKTYSNPNDTILDFCAGSGTTGLACMNTNRKCILI